MADPGVPLPGSPRPPGRLLGLIEPHVTDRLVPDEGEVVVDEVVHHWVVYVPRVLEILLAVGLAVLAVFVPVIVAFVPIIAAAVLVVRAVAKGLASWVDRFVITNLRVFRSWGLVSRQLATMPIQRILDISVSKPLLGRVLDYGHFQFESAAQDQGLRDIRYIARPFDRDLTMQRVIQRAGLRRGFPAVPDSDDGDGSSLWGRSDRSGPSPRGPEPPFDGPEPGEWDPTGPDPTGSDPSTPDSDGFGPPAPEDQDGWGPERDEPRRRGAVDTGPYGRSTAAAPRRRQPGSDERRPEPGRPRRDRPDR